MDIQELINTLTEVAEANPEAQVMIASQPSWPIANEVHGVTSLQWEGRTPEGHDPDAPTVWIVAGGQPYDDPYAPGWVFEA